MEAKNASKQQSVSKRSLRSEGRKSLHTITESPEQKSIVGKSGLSLKEAALAHSQVCGQVTLPAPPSGIFVLMQDIHRHIAAHKTYNVFGKFDLFQRSAKPKQKSEKIAAKDGENVEQSTPHRTTDEKAAVDKLTNEKRYIFNDSIWHRAFNEQMMSMNLMKFLIIIVLQAN